MANGKPSDPEDYVIRSGVRSGLKREFAFALKSQAELASSRSGGRSRTRSGKSPSSTPTLPPPRSDSNKRLKKSSSSASPLPAVADKIKPKEEEEEEEPVVEDPKGSQVDSLAAAPPVVLAVVEETSPTPTPPPPPPPPPPIVDANDVPKGSGDSLMEMEMEMAIDLPNKVGSGGTIEDGSTSIPHTPVPESSAADKLRIEDSVPAGSPPTPTPTRLVADNAVESPLTIDTKVQGIGVPLEKPTKRFTRSSLNVGGSSSGVENPVVVNVDPKDASCLPEKPPRRFTRSLLKPPADESSAGEVSATTTSGGSVGSEETKGGANVDDGSSTMTPSKKMELKMSKKIALSKFPTNVRDLLGTGLLEGYPVKYLVYVGKQYGLEGVIKGNSILCSCNFCKGARVVSAYNFEVHAGSTKKHPSDYIFLENGKSLRDVLKACTSAPLDMLESAIQNAAGPVPPSKPSTCQKCKESFHTPRTGKFALICDMCLEAPRPMTPRPLQGTPSNAKLSTKFLTGNASCGSYKKASSQKKSILQTKHLSEDASNIPSKNTSFQKKIMGKLTRKDLGLHKLVFMDDILPEGTEVGYYVRGQKLLEGYIKDSGIFCQCCNTVVSPSQFEAHAGRAQRRKPYNNIYTSNGVSLHELSVSLSKDRKMSASENDDLCSICADGGDLLLCDLCPRAFHKECVGLSSVPKGDWYCRYCHDMHQREKCLSTNNNAIAAGRVAGVDPIEQIINRCIRIVTKSTDIGGCSFCRSHDFSRSGFDDRTVMLCDQCEKEYHVGCMKDHNMCDLKELPEGEWFCSTDCSRIHASLQELLLKPKPLLDMHADIIKKKCEEKGVNKDNDVRWRLLSGKTSADAKLLLSEAVTIFHESFDPIVDAVTGRDLIPSMVYGRQVRDQDFGGMYCAVLTVNSSVVSAGILRVLGCEVAELPLVATSRDNQGLGYFQSLFSCIEKLLGSLKVKHFVLPSADEAKSIWTKKFGFSKITPDQLRNYAKGARPMIFQGTSLLYKPVP